MTINIHEHFTGLQAAAVLAIEIVWWVGVVTWWRRWHRKRVKK